MKPLDKSITLSGISLASGSRGANATGSESNRAVAIAGVVVATTLVTPVGRAMRESRLSVLLERERTIFGAVAVLLDPRMGLVVVLVTNPAIMGADRWRPKLGR